MRRKLVRHALRGANDLQEQLVIARVLAKLVIDQVQADV